MSVESVRILTLRLLSALSSRPSTAHAEAPPPPQYTVLYAAVLFSGINAGQCSRKREPLSQMAHHSYCVFTTSLVHIARVLLWSCSCHIGR